MGTTRVIVSRCMVGICHMQVCAVPDATDEEILEVCNRENCSGTSMGWTNVVRIAREDRPNSAPIACEQEPGRIHFLVAC